MSDTILSVSASKLLDITSKFPSNATLVIVTHTQKIHTKFFRVGRDTAVGIAIH